MSEMKKILVVDDSSTSTFLLESFFEEHGYDVTIADDGEKAIRKMSTFVPDVVFLDLMMPIKSGFDVLEMMQQDEALKKVPVIVISAKTEQEDIVRAKAMGAYEYIYKPVDIDYALELLRKLEV